MAGRGNLQVAETRSIVFRNDPEHLDAVLLPISTLRCRSGRRETGFLFSTLLPIQFALFKQAQCMRFSPLLQSG